MSHYDDIQQIASDCHGYFTASSARMACVRYTMDFDAARSVAEDEFVIRFNHRLKMGWSGFSGRLVRMPKAHPRDVPEAYVMQPFEVEVTYRDHAWCTGVLNSI